MGYSVKQTRVNPVDKVVSPTPPKSRVQGMTLKPRASTAKRKGHGTAFHKPLRAGTMRPFGPQ